MSDSRLPSRSDFVRSTAATAATLALLPATGTALPALADSLPAQDEWAVLNKLGSLMEGIWPRGNYPAADGAEQANIGGFMQISFQYVTFSLVPYAVIQKSTRYMDAIMRIAEYTFSHQHADGRFDYSESNGKVTTGSVQGPLSEASTATSFFYDFGHTLVLLPKAPWFASSPECAPFRARFAALREKCRISLDWLLAQRTLLEQDHAASNRTMAHAMSYYFLGLALDRKDAADAGRQIFRSVLDAQTSDGTFIEGGGFDSSYQAANLLQITWMYLNLDPADEALRASAWQAIKRGVARELPSVESSGEVSTEGNSRVRAVTGESYEGHRKGVNSKQVIAALGYYGVMAGDADVLQTTRSVYHFYFPTDKIDF